MLKLQAGMCLGLLGLATAYAQQAGDSAQRCEDLAQVSLPHTTIVQAAVVEAGKMTSPDTGPESAKDPIYAQLPAMCRVIAEAHPSEDSKIKIEVWLPVAGWNSRFMGVGNGGFAGNIYYHQLARAVLHGYAVGSTDTGHTGTSIEAAWALRHPEKVADFGYRGVHEMSVTGPAIAKAFYGQPAGHRYFDGCSDGGREALMEAQRFPTDYDGILAGAPAYNWTHLVSSGIHAYHAMMDDPARYIPPSKLPAISSAVLAQCKKDDAGGFLDDPRKCHFNPAAMVCKGKENDRCLTKPQVETLKALYAGSRTKDGKLVDYGLMPGGELGDNGWGSWVTGSSPSKSLGVAFLQGYFADMVYSKADFDVTKLNLDEGLKAAEEHTGTNLDAVNPDLSAFSGHGGKLILYHGWDDPAIPALGTIDYYTAVVARAGEANANDFTRLYLVSGMQHCDGGPGPTTFGQNEPYEDSAINDAEHNIYLALEGWVEKRSPPQKVITQKLEEHGGKSTVTESRPLCPYPQAAQYSGTGDRSSAASYFCAAAK